MFAIHIVMDHLLVSLLTLALTAPIQLSPVDQSTVTNSKLEWQIPSYPLYDGGNKYRVWVDDDSTFSSPEKNGVYLSNNYYTPSLDPGTYYWKVIAKDSLSTWSEDSEVWSFTLSLSTPTPSPTPVTSSSPEPTPSPSPTPLSTSITLSNTPQSVDVNNQFDVAVNITNFPANKQLYLKGAFRKSGSTNYFGQTKVSGNWIKNYETYSKQLSISTDQSGNWSGNISIQGDAADSGFIGEDDYLFKVGYYLDPSVLWSNETTIHLTGSITSTESKIDQTNSTQSPLNTDTTTDQPTITQDWSDSKEIAEIEYPNLNDILGTTSATLSAMTNSQTDILVDNIKVKSATSPLSTLLTLLGIGLLLGSGILGAWRFIPQNRLKRLRNWPRSWQKGLKQAVEPLHFSERWEQVKQLLPKGLLKG